MPFFTSGYALAAAAFVLGLGAGSAEPNHAVVVLRY
jgi:hypothetical protein